MAELFSWIKLGIENWKSILGLVTLILTAFGWYADNQVKAEQITKTQAQVRSVAEAYYPAVKKTLKTVHKTTIVKQDCGLCIKIQRDYKDHLQRYH